MSLFFFIKKFVDVSIIQISKDFAKISKENWKNDFRLIHIIEISLKPLYFHSKDRFGYPNEEPGNKMYRKLKIRLPVEHQPDSEK